MQELQKYLSSNKIQLALFLSAANDPCYRYFTGTNAGGILVVPAKSTPFIITNRMELERLREESRIKSIIAGNGKKASDIIKSKIKGIKRVGINKSALTVAMLANLRKSLKASYVGVGNYLIAQRAQKSPRELKVIEKACKLTDEIFEGVKKKRLSTELELAGFIEAKMRSLGVSPAFDTIVASGSNSSKPHSTPTAHKLKGACIIDMGVNYKGYCSDFTRTLFFSKPTRLMVEAYNAVKHAHNQLISSIKPGVKCSEIDRLGNRLLEDYKHNILHSHGHGVGIDVHEAPALAALSTEKIKEGMVLAVEPGVYFQGSFGIRIEDMIHITKQGAELLTHSSRDLIIR